MALGIALYVAIQIANHSANRAFEASVDVVAGKAQLEVTAPAGNLPDELFPTIAHQPGIAAATPLVRGLVTLPDFPGEYLDLLGIDILTNESFRTFDLTDFQTQQFDIQEWLRGPRTVAVSEELASRHQLHAGDRIRVQVNGKTTDLTIAYLLRTRGTPVQSLNSQFAAMDIGWAQEFLARGNTLDSISLRLTPGIDPEKIIAELRQKLPSDTRVAAPAQRGREVEKMLAGFQLNLQAMSLVSLLVGMFLIYNTVEASVVRRRHEIGILRSLGATRGEVRCLFLGEAVVLGAIGIALGLTGGYLLARGLVGTVAETISSLYVLLRVRQLSTSPWTWMSAIFLGLVSIVAAAWFPARVRQLSVPSRLCTTAPESSSPRVFPEDGSLAGGASLLLSVVLSILALRTGPPWLGFGSAFFVLAGFSAQLPCLQPAFSRMMTASMRQHVKVRLAAQNLGRAVLRNAVTIASLATAVAMTVGVAVMIFSFRRTVEDWINQTLVADLFIGPAANEIVGPTSFVAPSIIDYLEKNPAIESVDTYRAVEVPFRNQTIALAVVRGNSRRTLRFINGSNETIMRQFHNSQSVLISESFARRFHLAGGRRRCNSLLQKVSSTFSIAGVFFDYTRDQGTVFLSAKNFRKFWHDDRVNSLALYLKKDANAEAVAREVPRPFQRAGRILDLR